MPLGLHQNAKAAAVTALAEGLPHVGVTEGRLLDGFSAFLASYEADQALPQTGKLHEKLVDLVDELPLVEFVTGELMRELSESSIITYDPEAPRRALTELAGFEDSATTALRLIETFDSLPWQYSFTAQLAGDVFPDEMFVDGSLAVGTASNLAKPDLLFSEQFPLTHDNPNVKNRGMGGLLGLLIGAAEWKPESVCYQQERSGFVGIYGRGSLIDSVERRLESFLGLGLATRLLSYEYRYQNQKNTNRWIIHIRRDQNWELYTRLDMDEDISDVLRHIKSFTFANEYPENRRIPWLRGAVERCNQIFDSDKSSTLLLSTKWFFDSFKGKDETLRYIRLMTTLEILLGEHADT